MPPMPDPSDDPTSLGCTNLYISYGSVIPAIMSASETLTSAQSVVRSTCAAMSSGIPNALCDHPVGTGVQGVSYGRWRREPKRCD